MQAQEITLPLSGTSNAVALVVIPSLKQSNAEIKLG